MIRFMMVMTPIVLLINGYTKGDWWEAALFALSVAVGLTPEMLPMIVTSTLARGAVKLSKQKVIVKHLDAIQNFGAMDILCTDKTGHADPGQNCAGRTTPISPAKPGRSRAAQCLAEQPLPDRAEKPARRRRARRRG
jgi:high-affinity K+ transport system ATPase subunit B